MPHLDIVTSYCRGEKTTNNEKNIDKESETTLAQLISKEPENVFFSFVSLIVLKPTDVESSLEYKALQGNKIKCFAFKIESY